MNSKSQRFELHKEDIWKVVKGALVAAGGCMLAWATIQLGNIDESTTVGAIIASVGAIGINIFRKWIVDNGGQIDKK